MVIQPRNLAKTTGDKTSFEASNRAIRIIFAVKDPFARDRLSAKRKRN